MELSVQNAGFSYPQATPILQNINFTLHSGELMAVLGPNGAGKTTFLRCLMGFLPWSQGESWLDGEMIQNLPPRKRWQKMAYVPQAKKNGVSLLVGDMILLGCANRMGIFSVPGKKEKQRVEEVAEQLGISALLNQRCHEISGGELQMVLIARALAAQPEWLILDEPESNLDFKNQLLILETLSDLTASGMGCIFNTHYPTHALMYASKALLLPKNGEARFGNTADIVTEANIESVFGVKAMIGEFETPEKTYRSVLPLQIPSTQELQKTQMPNEEVTAMISMFFPLTLQNQIHGWIHKYQSYLRGSMEVPCLEEKICGLHLTLRAPRGEIQALCSQLELLPGVQVKMILARKQ